MKEQAERVFFSDHISGHLKFTSSAIGFSLKNDYALFCKFCWIYSSYHNFGVKGHL